MEDLKLIRQVTITLCAGSLPEGIHGCITTDSRPDAYIIALNSQDSPEGQQAALLHELLHLFRQDLEQAGSVDDLESDLHDKHSPGCWV